MQETDSDAQVRPIFTFLCILQRVVIAFFWIT